MNKIFKKWLFYFVQGLLFVFPLGVTAYVIFQFFLFVDGLIPTETPGLGLLLVVLSITALGLLANTIIAKPIFNYFEKLLNRVPLLKTVYSALSDLLSAFVGKKRSFKQAVLVQMDKEGILKKPGFITQSNLEELGLSDEVAVYLPHSYNFSGNLFLVEKRYVTELKVPAADVMKFIVSGGVSGLNEKGED